MTNYYAFDDNILTDTILPLNGNTFTIGNASTILVVNGNGFTFGEATAPFTLVGNPVILGTASTEFRISGEATMLTSFSIEALAANASAISINSGANSYFKINTTDNRVEFGRPIRGVLNSAVGQMYLENTTATFGTQVELKTGTNSSAQNFLKCVNGDSTTMFEFACNGELRVKHQINFNADPGTYNYISLRADEANALAFRDTNLETYFTINTADGVIEIFGNLSFANPDEGQNGIRIYTNLNDALSIRSAGIPMAIFRTTALKYAIDVFSQTNFQDIMTFNRPYYLMIASPIALDPLNVINGIIELNCGPGWTITIPDGSDIIAALSNPLVGQTFEFVIQNISAANSLTVNAGSEMTVIDATTFSPVGTNTMKRYIFRVVSLNSSPYFRVFNN